MKVGKVDQDGTDAVLRKGEGMERGRRDKIARVTVVIPPGVERPVVDPSGYRSRGSNLYPDVTKNQA
jgi:hypothetical protein